MPLRRTALHPLHLRWGGHLVPFAGWEMPLYYSGILEEHRAVRTSVGLFDVSHMGLIGVRGNSALELLARRTTANVARLAPGQCRYSFWLDNEGKIFDDLLVTRTDDGTPEEPEFLVVPNAAHADRIVELLQQHRKPDVSLLPLNPLASLLAVQGPRSREVLERGFGWRLESLPFYQARRLPLDTRATTPSEPMVGMTLPGDLDKWALVSRTGYTGELGYEILVDSSRAPAIVERLRESGVIPCGLGARDTLRLEKGYLLSGQDFHRDRTPLEAGQERFVDFDHVFVGREALERQKSQGVPVQLVGVALRETGAIPRHGTPLLSEGKVVAHATSGGLSPSLGFGIALAYLPPALAGLGQRLEAEIRGRRTPATVERIPFYPARAAAAS